MAGLGNKVLPVEKLVMTSWEEGCSVFPPEPWLLENTEKLLQGKEVKVNGSETPMQTRGSLSKETMSPGFHSMMSRC